MEDEYGFTISDVPAKVIVKDSIISYTLLIERDSINPIFFENLVINTNLNTEETTAYTVKYNLSSFPIPAEHNSVSFTADVEVTPIVFNSSESSATNKETLCMYMQFLLCDYGGATHPAGAGCVNTYYGGDILVGCWEVGGDGDPDPDPEDDPGEDPNSGGNPGGGTTNPGGGGGSTPPIITVTVPNPLGEINYIDPKCEQLYGLKGKFLVKLLDLKKNLDLNKETGYALKKAADGQRFAYNIPSSPNTPNQLLIRMVPNQYGILHNHPVGNYEMFSMHDVNTLREIYENYSVPATASQTGLAKTFLKFIKKMNLGISLYRTDNSFGGKWEKLELNPQDNDTDLILSNCN